MTSRLLTILLALPLLFSGSAIAGAQEKPEKTVDVTTRATRQGWLGVEIRDLTAKTAKKKNLKTEEGALVAKVTEKSPAETAGIKDGDVIVEFNGHTIYDSDDLTKAVRRTKPGTNVPVVVQRDSEKKTLQVTIGKMKHDPWRVFGFAPKATPAPHIRIMQRSSSYGLSLQDLNQQLGEYFGAPDGKGVLVQEVEKESDAAKAGFSAGDIIVRIGTETIQDIEDVHEALGEYKEGEKAEVEVLRRGSKKTFMLTINEEDLSNVYEFQTQEVSPDMHFEMFGDDPHMKELRLELQGLQEHIRGSLKPQIEQLKKNLKSMGRNIREQIKEAQYNIQRELPHTTI
jgi:C-terminal processing protease CtpA/Prc